MREIKSEKIKEAIKHLAAEFLSEVSNRSSLITVTDVSLSSKGDRAVIFITVYPEDAEKKALDFARRNAGLLRKKIANRLLIHHLPFVSFALDIGEKNRQRLTELSAR